MCSRLLASVIVVSAACVAARGQDLSHLAPQEGVVLLRNGEVLAGKFTTAGDYCFVAQGTGEIRLRASDVELFAHDIDDGYRQKRERIDPRDVRQTLELALWCIRNELYGYAAREIRQALAADPDDPRIALVERRLELARTRPAEVAVELEASSYRVSNEELDRMVRGMPGRSVEMFTTTIQPLLMNYCATAGCHGPSSSTFSLDRLPAGRNLSRRLTQRNLHAVLAWVDVTSPLDSRLLLAPIAPHGTARTAIFTSRDLRQYQQLVNWVQGLQSAELPSGDPLPQSTARPAEASRPTPPPLPSPGAAVVPTAFLESLESPQEGLGAAREGAVEAASEQDAEPRLRRIQRGAPVDTYEPVDPFDPELFNRRYRN